MRPTCALIEVEDSTATVETAAKALGVEPGRIAKTLAVRAGEHLFLLVARGNARLDNRKCKDEFGARPRMLGAGRDARADRPSGRRRLPVRPEDAAARLSRRVAARRSTSSIPAGGSLNTSVEVPTERLFELVGERWVDLCRLPEEAAGA